MNTTKIIQHVREHVLQQSNIQIIQRVRGHDPMSIEPRTFTDDMSGEFQTAIYTVLMDVRELPSGWENQS